MDTTMKNSNTTQTDELTPDQGTINAIEEQMDRYQSATTWQAALADAEAHGDETARDSQIDAIEAEIQRAEMREGWLADRMADVRYSDGALYYDRATRQLDAIETELGRVEARLAQLTELRAALQDAADDYGPGANANYDAADNPDAIEAEIDRAQMRDGWLADRLAEDAADDYGPDAGIETTVCQA